mmetsp:Transcript_41883/g.112167  ORF Transcript_41883/g.112167 Transcript_41883/m.112167 type:complete len:170 (-) Transcript_41883:118-627(-)
MRGVGGSTGTKTLVGCDEIRDVEAVCKWAHKRLGRDLVIMGSSGGAPIGGSAVDSHPFVRAYVGIGYVFGSIPSPSVSFSPHFDAIVRTSKPRLFIMGADDCFTSPALLQFMMDKMTKGPRERQLIPGVGHFELEGPDFDSLVATAAMEFICRVVPDPRVEPPRGDEQG